jgi:ubiquinone/menaquinone biosynthesis C-methylase UbiE
MGWYSNYLFPWIVDKVMSNKVMIQQRRQVLAAAQGRVLEIGFGTGLNLPHYPASVRSLTIVDPNAGMHRRAARRLADSPIPLEAIQLRAEDQLPVAENSFDTAVSTWTMCSIPNLAGALAELARVLRPGGRLIFVEHGLSSEPAIARWQNRLNPINMRIGDGCHLNRDIARFIDDSPLVLERCDRFYLPRTPRIHGFTYRGSAIKAA